MGSAALRMVTILTALLLTASATADSSPLATGWTPLTRAGTEAAPGQAPVTDFDMSQRVHGRYRQAWTFSVSARGRYVLDFRNSSTLGRFRHVVQDDAGRSVAVLVGGIQSSEPNPFFLRHGRELDLTAGTYRVVTEMTSPFFLATPEPFVTQLAHYRQIIKLTNLITLLGLGLFLGLGFYYAAYGVAKRRLAEAMYAFFMLGNFLYNGAALLVFSDVLHLHWFYLVSLPILFSNAAYIVFVLALLEIQPQSHPLLYRAAQVILGMFGCFILLAGLAPELSLELDRIGVGIFTTFGLVAAVVRTREGQRSARLYLVAVLTLFLLAVVAISLSRVDADSFYVEHLGLVAVAAESVLLALVLAQHTATSRAEPLRDGSGSQFSGPGALTGS